MMIVLEGLPGAGKTTLTDRLIREHGYAAVPEMLMEYIDPEDGFITFEFEKYFLKNDEFKCQEAKKLLKKNKTVVMDKNYISTLAFNYAVTECQRGKTYNDVCRWYRQNQRRFIKPDLYFFLSMPINLCFSRKNRTADASSFWNSREFLTKMNNFFDSEFKNFDPAVPKHKINAEKSQDEMLNEILMIIAKSGS